jgi:hypothetical protein
MQEIGKDMRMQLAMQQREQGSQQQAIAKQIAYLETLGISVSNGITKQKAAELIDKMKGSSSKQR